jgi:hypothetical protein
MKGDQAAAGVKCSWQLAVGSWQLLVVSCLWLLSPAIWPERPPEGQRDALADISQQHLARACCEMSQRDGAIVAWHEVPGKTPPKRAVP